MSVTSTSGIPCVANACLNFSMVTSDVTPAELLMNRKLRTKLDFVKPEIRERVENRQKKFKHYHDSHAKGRTFREGDAVIVKVFQVDSGNVGK